MGNTEKNESLSKQVYVLNVKTDDFLLRTESELNKKYLELRSIKKRRNCKIDIISESLKDEDYYTKYHDLKKMMNELRHKYKDYKNAGNIDGLARMKDKMKSSSDEYKEIENEYLVKNEKYLRFMKWVRKYRKKRNKLLNDTKESFKKMIEDNSKQRVLNQDTVLDENGEIKSSVQISLISNVQ